jgi:hypothetical protein
MTMISSLQTEKGNRESFTTASLSLSYLADAQWSGTISYTDQTILGDPKNTSLGKGILFQLQKRWAR